MNLRISLLLSASCLVLAGLLGSSVAIAQSDVGTTDEVDISRPGDELTDRLPVKPVDLDHVDTALVFTNPGLGKLRVRCIGYDHEGRAIGRVRVAVPSQGLRYVLASDLSHGRDFVGSAQCTSGGHAIGSAVWLGPGITDLPVQQGSPDGRTRIRFAVIATY